MRPQWGAPVGQTAKAKGWCWDTHSSSRVGGVLRDPPSLISSEDVLKRVMSCGAEPLHPGVSAPEGVGLKKAGRGAQALWPQRWSKSLLRSEKQSDSILSTVGKYQKHNQEP